MDNITIFNLREVNKGALKATVSIRLGSDLTIHDCKIIQQDGALSAALPQRSERQKGGEVVYHDLVEFADPTTWPTIAPQLVAYYCLHLGGLKPPPLGGSFSELGVS